jgi:hypothetical protein
VGRPRSRRCSGRSGSALTDDRHSLACAERSGRARLTAPPTPSSSSSGAWASGVSAKATASPYRSSSPAPRRIFESILRRRVPSAMRCLLWILVTSSHQTARTHASSRLSARLLFGMRLGRVPPSALSAATGVSPLPFVDRPPDSSRSVSMRSGERICGYRAVGEQSP